MFPDRRPAFYGLDEYTIFNPADLNIKNKTSDVPIQLTNLQINNEVQEFNFANRLVNSL